MVKKLKFQDYPNISAPTQARLLKIRRSRKLNTMSTIADRFATSRVFCQAVNAAEKYVADDIPFLRYYFLKKQGTSTFLFQWLDKLERGGLTREQVLSIVHGTDYQHEDIEESKKPSSPKKRKYTARRAKTPTDDEESPTATPVTSPTRPSSKKRTVAHEEEEPVTPKAPPKKKRIAPPPPAKNPRPSKKENQVIDESDIDEEDDGSESSSSDDDQDDDDFQRR